MTTTKNFLVLFATLFISSVSLSQDKVAESILKDLSEKTKSYTSMSAKFTYEKDNSDAKIHEEQLGTLIVMGNSYKVNIAGQQVVCDGKTIWTYLPDAAEVQINSVDETDESAFTPTKLLSSYTEDYKAKNVKEVTFKNRTVYAIELEPLKDKNYKSVELKIDKEKLNIAQLTIYDKSKNVFKYTVNDFQSNLPLKPADFTFDPSKYPNIEVIDMR
jgi:outer membrane lipoprotein-sorting protein